MGTYNEQLNITKPITLHGDGPTTTIEPSPVTANTTSLHSGNPIAAIILVDGTTVVTIEDLTVDGSAGAPGSCSPGYVGVFFRASSGTIDASRVTYIFSPTAPGCQTVLGIFVQSGNGGPGLNSTVVITGNTIDKYGKNGITANEPGTDVTVMNNTVTGRGPVGPGDAAQNGVQVAFGAHGRVTSNNVTLNNYTPPDFVACGLLFFQGGGGIGKASTNTFAGNEKNVCTTGNGPQN